MLNCLLIHFFDNLYGFNVVQIAAIHCNLVNKFSSTHCICKRISIRITKWLFFQIDLFSIFFLFSVYHAKTFGNDALIIDFVEILYDVTCTFIFTKYLIFLLNCSSNLKFFYGSKKCFFPKK